MSSSKRPAMGRGLSALLKTDTNSATNAIAAERSVSGIFEVEINDIETNPLQPRSNFEEGPLNDLAISIKSLGIIQPITVRNIESGKYQIISGERRYRAAEIAGLESIPVFVRLANDQEILEMALVENIQRRDLDPMEVALCYNRLMVECLLTQQEVSDRVGKNRSTIANYLGLLKLSPLVQAGLRDRDISMGHARSLVGIEDNDQRNSLYHQCVKGSWSVRQLEYAVRAINQKKRSPLTTKNIDAGKSFSNQIGLPAKVIVNPNGSGKIILSFLDAEELKTALDRISE